MRQAKFFIKPLLFGLITAVISGFILPPISQAAEAASTWGYVRNLDSGRFTLVSPNGKVFLVATSASTVVIVDKTPKSVNDLKNGLFGQIKGLRIGASRSVILASEITVSSAMGWGIISDLAASGFTLMPTTNYSIPKSITFASSTAVIIDGQTASVSDLKNGMVGQVKGLWTSNNFKGITADLVDMNRPSTPPALNVSLGADTPPSQSAVAGSAFVPFTIFDFIAYAKPVEVHSITVHRVGLGSDADFTNIYLFSGNQVLGKTILQDKAALFRNADNTPLFVIPANSATKVIVKANLSGNATIGGYNAFELTSVSDIIAFPEAVSGAFPLAGNRMINMAATNPKLATLAVDAPMDVPTKIPVGSANSRVAQFRLQAGNSPVILKSVAVNLVGSTAPTAFSNLKLFLGGVQIGETISSIPASQAVFFDFSSSGQVTIAPGAAADLLLFADISSGQGTSFNFSVKNDYDVQALDSIYLAGILPGGTFPVQQASLIEIITAP